MQPRSDSPRNVSSLSITRRSLLKALPFMPLAAHSLAQQDATPRPIQVSGLHSFGLRVSNVERSVAFYQGLFGMPILARQGGTVSLRIGDGPRHFTLSPTRSGEQPHISHFGLAVPDYDLERLRNRLAEHGATRTTTIFRGQPTLDRALLNWVVRRSSGDGDMRDNQQLFLADRDGIGILLCSPRSCGGAGRLGQICGANEPAPEPARIQLREINHFTSFISNRELSNRFYQEVFGLQVQAYQGEGSPILGVGDGGQFLMFVGGSEPGEPESPGRIDHACFTMDDFDVESVRGILSDYGLSARPEDTEAQPLQHWVSMRMPDRGGAPGGTPELYFSDPDGIHLQLQHVDYCGGGGRLGDACSR